MFGTPGLGGQMAYGDVAQSLGWGFVTNYPTMGAVANDARYEALIKTVYETVANFKK